MEKPYERLRQARVAAGFKSASAAAREFGWGEAAYRHHENGTRGYGVEQAVQYGEAFKVSPTWLLDLGLGRSDTWRVPLGKFYTEVSYPELTWQDGVEELVNAAADTLNLSFVLELEITATSIEVRRTPEGALQFHLISPEVVGISADKFTRGFIVATRAPTQTPLAIVRPNDLILVDSERGEIGDKPELWLLRSYDELLVCWATLSNDGVAIAVPNVVGQAASELDPNLNVLGLVVWVGKRI
jgi:hypothetical protein